MINEKSNIGILGEFAILIYFVTLFLGIWIFDKKAAIYPYLSLIFFILLVAFSFIQQTSIAEQFAVFLFYSLTSQLIFSLVSYITHYEK